MARISTHVLDIARGCPAEGVRIELHGPDLIRTARTNADGRTAEPLLQAESIESRTYELVFHAGEYFRAQGMPQEPLFLDEITIRFGVSDPQGNYHVPLLLAPYGYSTYRGS